MKRTIIKINEALCNGCGLCVKGCHEGALRLIDGKATLISELYCDGLGACIGDCPRGAITQEEREAEKYDEKAVIKRLIPKGEEVIKAHLQHLSDHKQVEFLREAHEELRQQGIHDIPIRPVSSSPTFSCPGSKTRSFVPEPLRLSQRRRSRRENCDNGRYSCIYYRRPHPFSRMRTYWSPQIVPLTP